MKHYNTRVIECERGSILKILLQRKTSHCPCIIITMTEAQEEWQVSKGQEKKYNKTDSHLSIFSPISLQKYQ